MHNNNTLKATIKLPQAIALYVGAVLGSGVLIVPGITAEIAGPSSLLVWGMMILLVIPMALTMGLLSAKFPNSGGVSFFVTKAFNSHLGSLVGWFFLMSVPIGAPVVALTGAGYICTSVGLDSEFKIVVAAMILVVGLLVNYLGMKIAGQIQVAVVLTTIIILLVSSFVAIPDIKSSNFTPFMPNGWVSVGIASSIVYWCFIGWEAISHLSEEFIDPQRTAIKGTIIAAIIIGLLYFLTALSVVGTHSYGSNASDASLIIIIKNSLGTNGALLAGFASLFICIAPAIAYIGAASRLAYSLSINGDAPKFLSNVSKKYNTPSGGLAFLTVCFIIVLAIYNTGIISLSLLLQIPNATFILTYIGGCAAGIILLKDDKFGLAISIISLVISVIIFLFVGWTILYPLAIVIIRYLYVSFFNHVRKNHSELT